MQGRTAIWVVVIIIVAGLIAWYAGLFGGTPAPAPAPAPAATTTTAPAPSAG
jgi:hypothetical protein